MSSLQLHRDAHTELEVAAGWYELQRAGLGDEFLSEVRRAFEHIQESPRRWPVWLSHGREPIRRYVLADFPFVVAYLALEDAVVVLAIAHVRRRPGYWLRRARR